MLDAILCPNWELRYFSFQAQWGEDEQLASMRNGSGDEWYLFFSPAGVALKGFAHESPVAAAGGFGTAIRKALPPVLKGFVDEPAFAIDDSSFCYWRTAQDSTWSKVTSGGPADNEIEDGSFDLLRFVLGTASDYQTHAATYFEMNVPLEMIEMIFSFAPLRNVRLEVLPIERSVSDLEEEAKSIGYPFA